MLGRLSRRFKHYLIRYHYVENMEQRRVPHRSEHLEYWASVERDVKDTRMVIGGALQDPIDTGVLVFESDTAENVERIVQNDPYFEYKLI